MENNLVLWLSRELGLGQSFDPRVDNGGQTAIVAPGKSLGMGPSGTSSSPQRAEAASRRLLSRAQVEDIIYGTPPQLAHR
jgi:hypothetical protein